MPFFIALSFHIRVILSGITIKILFADEFPNNHQSREQLDKHSMKNQQKKKRKYRKRF